MSASFDIPLDCGKLTLAPGSGHCIAPDCKKSGGGMIDVTVREGDHRPMTLCLCGDHLMNLGWVTTGFNEALEQAFAAKKEEQNG